ALAGRGEMKRENEEGIDWWQVGAVVALTGIVVVDIVVPGRIIAPLAAAAERLDLEDGEEVSAERPLPRLPSEAWPVVALVAGVLVMGLAALRMLREQAVEGRWLWILAVAAATVLWSAGVLAALHKAEKALMGLSSGL
ncbi:MAG: hypothetical protein N2512_07695, partial [Armatimonadetes bacterium]|nr:hypothetical protein [Armatimonadota bacterium]